MKNHTSKERGAVAIYLALLVTIIILSGALLQSGILAQQIRFSTDILENERAFYISDSGIEATLFDLEKKIGQGDFSDSAIDGSISYGEKEATFNATGRIIVSDDQSRTTACVESTGISGRESRRTAVGNQDCD